mgnify:CR=1 FL=1
MTPSLAEALSKLLANGQANIIINNLTINGDVQIGDRIVNLAAENLLTCAVCGRQGKSDWNFVEDLGRVMHRACFPQRQRLNFTPRRTAPDRMKARIK